ncbi:MAG: ABC transporter permease [Planctomycetota bacterium]
MKTTATSNFGFHALLVALSAIYLVLILAMILADFLYVTRGEFVSAISKPEILASTILTLKTCTVSAILAVWVGTPLGYLIARKKFPGRMLVDLIVDIPMVLPPLVVGLSLLILFHLMLGDWQLESWLRDGVGFPVTFHWPAIVLAQFSVSCAFVVKTMKVAFEQSSPRYEEVARTLGCSQGQAFLHISLPIAWNGLLTGFTIAWARSLGEFGPILVFAGATRMKTEVLSTSIFLELSVGQLGSAVAVALMMVAISIMVLILLRFFSGGKS